MNFRMARIRGGRIATSSGFTLIELLVVVSLIVVLASMGMSQNRSSVIHTREAVLKEDLSKLSWMGETTRKAAIAKLDAFVNKIGYPDKWRDYSRAEVVRDSYVVNRVRIGRFNVERDMRVVEGAA